ncbi:MAG: gamma-glutamyltransferase family protein [Alphaproteobacteria bacterium]|jgi:gamma-glutamyltranspeptidase/glutathione hydrolase
MSDWSFPFLDRVEVKGTFGVVAGSHKIASQTAMGVLERGGNAFDAAVAAGFVFQVIEPHMNGLGGEAVMMVCPHDAGIPTVICGQGTAPANATIEKVKASGRDIMPPTGVLPAVVPGAFDAWMLLLRDYGTIRLQEALEPAVTYAENGYHLSAEVIRDISKSAAHLSRLWPSTAEIFLPNCIVPAVGSIATNRPLAATYRRLLQEAQASSVDRVEQIEAARRAFYRGFVADAIEQFVRSGPIPDDNGVYEDALISAQDLYNWSASTDAPVSVDFRGNRIYKAGFWSQSPVMLQMLQLVATDDLEVLDPVGPELSHLCIEAAKLAYADREAWYGDPSFVAVPGAALLSSEYARERRKLIGHYASSELIAGAPAGQVGSLPAGRTGYAAKRAAVSGRRARTGPAEGDTCHINVCDKWGNIVSATPSGGWLQGSPVVPGLGFPLSTRGQIFGLEKGFANSLEPGKRPRTTLSPGIAIGIANERRMGFGSKGADYADQWSFLFTIRHICMGLSLQGAIDSPMLGVEHWPNSLFPKIAYPRRVQMDPRFPEASIACLREQGHEIVIADRYRQGRHCAVLVDGIERIGASTLRLPHAAAVGR